MSAAARGIGVSVTAISQFLSGKYKGDNQKLARRVESWLQRVSERREYNEVFIETIDTFALRIIWKACRDAHIQSEMAVITGPSGVGKTRGLRAYAKENPDVVFLRVLPCYSMRDMLSEIHRMVGFSGHTRVTDMAADIIEKLKGSGRLLIIDEAEHLPYKALEMLRAIYDRAGVGIVLAGMRHLILNIRGSKGQFKQIYSRIGRHAEVPTMERHPEDIEKLVSHAIPGSNGIWKAFAEQTDNARQLEKLVKMSIQIAQKNDSPVTGQIVKQAKKYIII